MSGVSEGASERADERCGANERADERSGANEWPIFHCAASDKSVPLCNVKNKEEAGKDKMGGQNREKKRRGRNNMNSQFPLTENTCRKPKIIFEWSEKPETDVGSPNAF